MRLTVEAYANKKGISKAAVYKQIQSGKLDKFLSTENGIKYIDDSAIQENTAAPKEKAETENDLLYQTIAEQKAEIAELKAELKEQRQAQTQTQQLILSLLDKQIQIQENFQILLARQQLPQAASAETENAAQQTVETVENEVEQVEQKVETGNPEKRRKWRLFRRRDDSTNG